MSALGDSLAKLFELLEEWGRRQYVMFDLLKLVVPLLLTTRADLLSREPPFKNPQAIYLGSRS